MRVYVCVCDKPVKELVDIKFRLHFLYNNLENEIYIKNYLQVYFQQIGKWVDL